MLRAIWSSRKSLTSLAPVVVVFALVGCGEGPTSSTPPAPPGERAQTLVQGMACRGDIGALHLSCSNTTTDPSRSVFLSGDVSLGDPWVALASDAVSYDGSQVFQADVTVQNMIAQKLGTLDGTALAPNGIRVWYYMEPMVATGSGAVTPNCDGFADFTGTNQCYLRYDEILDAGPAPPPTAGGTSQAKTWTWDVDPTVETFTFSVFVWAPIQYESGWVDLSPADPEVGIGLTEQLMPVARDRLGREASGRTVTCSTSDTEFVSVDPGSCELTGLAEGTATVCASSPGPEVDGCVTVAVKPVIHVRTLADPTNPPVASAATITLQVDVTQIPEPLTSMVGNVTWDAALLDYQDDAAGAIWDLVLANEDPAGTLQLSAVSAAGVEGDVLDALTFTVNGLAEGCTDLMPTLSELSAIDPATFDTIDLQARAILMAESATVCVTAP